MFRNRGISFKLAFSILACGGAVFAVIFAYNYFYSRRIIVRKIEENAEELVDLTVGRIESVLRAVEKVPQNLAYALEDSSYSNEGLKKLLRAVVKHNPEIYGATIAFEPCAFNGKTVAFAPYYYKSGEEVRYSDLAADSYRYFDWDWYRLPKERDRPVWSEPYYDEGGGNVVMSTYSVPFYREADGKKKLMGIVTADIHLSWLQDLVSSIKIAETGYGFLISRKGTIVTHPRGELIMKETLPGIAGKSGDRRLAEIAADMMRGKSGFALTASLMTSKQCWLAYAPVPSAGWSLGVLFPRGELMADVFKLNRVVLGLGILGFLLLTAVIISLSSSITRPLRALSRTTREVARGNLDFDLGKPRSGDEVGKLAESFVRMRDELKRYIAELTAATAARERMESELKIARDIQMGMVPKIFPPFPERAEFDLYAALEPAREVGGDLYDFFLLEDGRLCFAIGDVSGKGVPAALFMAMVGTLLKAAARSDREPGAVLSRVNRELSADNKGCIFVSVFCGVLDPETGRVAYSNAGHNPPLIVRRDGTVKFLEGIGGSVVGIDGDAHYQVGTVALRPGDLLGMYTDGVTEAFSAAGEQFSEKRLAAAASGLRGASAREMVEGILASVRSFAAGAPQSDDITVMALEYRGAAGKESRA